MIKIFHISILIISIISSACFGATVTVNNLGDQPAANPVISPDSTIGAGQITLRSTIQYINAQAQASNTINFNVPSPFIITPQTNLDSIVFPVVIDGYSQPGATPNTLIDADNANIIVQLIGPGSALPTVTNGLILDVGSNGSIVKGLAINNFLGDGVFTFGAALTINSDSCSVAGNYIGVDTTGLNTQPIVVGVLINGNSNLVGTANPADRNLFAGGVLGASNHFTISLLAPQQIGSIVVNGTNNTIQSNFFGTDKTGNAALQNDVGVRIFGNNNIIGGLGDNTFNIINSGMWGIEIWASMTNSVQGNRIGTNYYGTKAFDSHGIGVGVYFGAQNNTITQNLISGFSKGIELGVANTPVTGTIIQSNKIGTDITGTQRMGNSLWGIKLQYATNTVIGGDIASLGNLISGNGNAGIFIADDVTGTTIQNNLIGTDVSGKIAIPNELDGIRCGTPLALLNTNTSILDNVISGNSSNGITLRSFSSNNTVQNNMIGVDISGTKKLLNNGNGVYISCSSNNTIGS